MKTLKYIYTVLLGMILFSCTERKSENSKEVEQVAPEFVVLSNAQIKNAGIQTGRAETREMSESVVVNGVVDVPPQNVVSVSFPLGGYFKYTRMLPGMKIARGQTLAVIEDQSFIQLQQDYLVAKAKLSALSEDYRRQKVLNASKTSSDKTFQLAQSEYVTQQIALKALAEKLLMLGVNPARLTVNSISRSIAIHSPINGFVVKVNANAGKYVNPTDVLLELVNTDDLHLALTVFEKDLNRIKPGMTVTAHPTSDTSRLYTAEVILSGKDLDEDRSTTVHCHFKGKTAGLIPGMFLQAEIESGKRAVMAVPDDAVVRYGDKEYIFVAEAKNHFRQVEIKSGKTERGYTEIMTTESIKGKPVVTSNAYSILMKMKNTGEEE